MRNSIRSALCALFFFLAISAGPLDASAETSVEERLERLEREQKAMKEKLEEKDARIEKLEAELDRREAAGEPAEEAAEGTAEATATESGSEEEAAGEMPTPEDASRTDQAEDQSKDQAEEWGVYDPGEGCVIGRNRLGEASISAYAVVRYINQMDSNRTFRDHLGQVREVATRENIQAHRTIVWLSGWLATPKFRYQIA